MRPTSFSQNNMFSKCARQWYYAYIKKIPTIQDMSYADAGTVVHKIMQNYYNWQDNSLEKMKIEFKKLWEKYKLHEGMLKNKADEYWLMCVTGFNCKQKITSNELRIIYSDVVAYLDFVDTTNDIIGDWKSSKRRQENEEEYIQQVKFYSYLYNLKFSRLPKKAIVYYLRYDGTKGILEYIPTTKDMIKVEEWHFDIRKKMEEIIDKNIVPPKVEVCNPWCPYKGLCKGDDGDCVKFKLNIVGNYIQIQGLISPVLNKQLHKKFSYELKNAYFIKKNNPHARTTIDFWSESRQLLPLGFKEGLLKTLKDYGEFKKKPLVLDFDDTRTFDDTKIKMPDKFINGKELRDYQLEITDEFLRKKIAMIEAATGSGKTLIACEMIRRLGIKTLIMVNRIELLNQWKGVLEETLGIKVGVIGQGEEDIQPITIATIQTIYKNIKKYSPYLKTVRFSIMDECHNVNNLSYWRTSLHLLNTEYRLGLSGTPRRSDGNDLYLFAVNGNICYSLNASKLIDKGWLMKPTIKFIKDFMTDDEVKLLEDSTKEGLINETEKFNAIYKAFILNNKKRNSLIKDIADINKGKKVLVLVKLIKHGERLSEMLNAVYLHGSTSKQEREKIMEDFKNGKINVLVGTLSIFSEGLDIPILQVLVNASGQKSDIKSVQTLGRLLRKHEGKDSCIYYDFIDESRYMRSASFSRLNSFKKEEHIVEVINKL